MGPVDIVEREQDDLPRPQAVEVVNPMLGIKAAVGRTLLPSDDVARGGHPVVMLDYRYWLSAFAGDPDVVGREMRVGDRAYTVIGVGPAGGAGIGLAVWLLELLATADLPLPTRLTLDLSLDGNVLAFKLGVSVVTGALLGLVPALQSTRPDVAGALRGESAGGGQPGQLRWRNALVVTQLTISLVLLVGAGLFLRSFQQVQSVDPGFGREPTAIMTFLMSATRFTPDAARVYTRRLLDRFRELPGVEAVGAISNLHLQPLNTSTSDFNVDGFEPQTEHGAFIADRAEVEPGFFEAAGIEILRGRNFNDADRPDTQPVVIISEAMARRFWTDGDAVGRQVRRRDDDPPWLVVGVASGRRCGRAPGLRARAGSRPVGPRDEDDGPPPRPDAAAPAALRLRPVGVRGAGAGTGRSRSLRRGQLRSLPADARDRHPDGARRRRLPRDPAARRGWPQAGGHRWRPSD